MSRLLFAAARGARFCYFNKSIGWCDMSIGHMVDAQSKAVIHPDDAHLQYGTISTAYREAAKGPEGYPDVLVKDIGAIYASIKDYYDYKQADNMTKQLYLLFLAEYLADEGL